MTDGAHRHNDDHDPSARGHSEHHGHPHGGHGHSHAISADADTRLLTIALALNFGFMVVEVVVGLLANSLALISDAGHMLTDAAAIGLALVADAWPRRPSSATRVPG